MKNLKVYIIAFFLTGFALLTLFLSSSVIFDFFDLRAKEGNYVLFVVWANFICSILYLFAAYGFLNQKNWTTTTLIISTAILIITFIGLQFHIRSGGIYETKTIGALIFRTAVTLIFTILAYFTITKKLKELKN